MWQEEDSDQGELFCWWRADYDQANLELKILMTEAMSYMNNFTSWLPMIRNITLLSITSPLKVRLNSSLCCCSSHLSTCYRNRRTSAVRLPSLDHAELPGTDPELFAKGRLFWGYAVQHWEQESKVIRKNLAKKRMELFEASSEDHDLIRYLTSASGENQTKLRPSSRDPSARLWWTFWTRR